VEWALLSAVAAGLAVLSWWSAGPARLELRERGDLVAAQARTQRVRRLGSATVTGVAVALATVSFGVLSLIMGAAAVAASYYLLGRLAREVDAKRDQRLARDVSQVCDLLVVCLEAGLPLRVAAAAVARSWEGPMAEELAAVTAKVRLGIDEQRAWAEFGASPPLAKLGRELSRGVDSGVSLTSRVAALGVDARREAAAAAETDAKKVGVSSVLPLMACFLPAFVLIGVVPIVGGMVLHLLG
jgi:pilus assembly protein TadC